MINIFTNGCFDILHAGHIKLFYKAKQLGDVLHVGINSDESIKKIKGSSRPILSQDDRFELVAAIKYVDRVYIFDDLTPIKLIEEIMPDIIVKGSDWKPEDVVGNRIAKVVTVSLVSNISTTKIIERIKNND
jgi:D-beta-D-heptose 7-phosphate kinase/D-beta-D-heptose 1-phosphate adenosyltransferase